MKASISLGACALAIACPRSSLAQEAETASADAGGGEIVVTGSRLASTRHSDPNPVQIITDAAIRKTSATNVGDYLMHVPSIGSTGSSNANSLKSGGDGLNCADLRNLRQSRVLVLVDGRRQVQTMGTGQMCVDLNQLPISQIASIEILKDGGSELYGADAVAGVINVKLRHDIDYGEFRLRGAVTSFGDNGTQMASFAKGWNFGGGRGNISIFGQYRAQAGNFQRDREFSRLASSNNPAPGAAAVYGSGLTIPTRVDPSRLNLISNGDGTFHKYTTADNYNYAEEQTMFARTRDGTVSLDAHYTFSDAITLYADGRYSNRRVRSISSGPTVQGSGSATSTLPSTFILPAGNPYNQWGRDVVLYKRFGDVGNSPRTLDIDNYQAVLGFNGEVFGGWKYDTSATYGKSTSNGHIYNRINYARLLQQLGIRQVNPASASSPVVYDPTICTSQPGCNLVNPFVPWSGAAAEYISYTTTDVGKYEFFDYNLRINNDKLFTLPYAGGGNVGIAFGLEHRWERGSFMPDSETLAGNIAGQSSQVTAGSFQVTELYGEVRIPLLHNASFTKDLTVDLQGRWSDYNTSGTTRNWKVGLNWAPVSDIRFKATYGTSYRQPSINELYGGQTVALSAAIDPCAQPRTYGSAAATVVANCARYGVDTATFTSAWSGLLPTLTGGSSALTPETGKTLTFGTEITPRWLPGLSVSAGYWRYRIENTISTVGPQYVLDQCFTNASSPFCASVAPRSSSGQITQVYTLFQNLGRVRTQGIDIDASYTLHLTDADTLLLSTNFQRLLKYEQQNIPNGPWLDYTGRIIYLSGYGYPKLRNYTSATWNHEKLSVTYMMNYMGAMTYNNGTRDLTPATNQYYRVGAVVTHDAQVTVDAGQMTFSVGVNNLTNRQAPYIPSGVFNTAAGLYGQQVLGRYIFAEAGVKF